MAYQNTPSVNSNVDRDVLEQARRSYAEGKARHLSSQLQETSVAIFELDHLPERRQVSEETNPAVMCVVFKVSFLQYLGR